MPSNAPGDSGNTETTTPSNDPGDWGSGLSAGAIAAIAVTVFVVIIL